MLAYASVPANALRWTRGEPRRRRSSPTAGRTFCGVCGAQITMQLHGRPEVLDFTSATLDDPDVLAPAFHIWDRSRIAWFQIADKAPRYPRGRPNEPPSTPGRRDAPAPADSRHPAGELTVVQNKHVAADGTDRRQDR